MPGSLVVNAGPEIFLWPTLDMGFPDHAPGDTDDWVKRGTPLLVVGVQQNPAGHRACLVLGPRGVGWVNVLWVRLEGS